MEINHCPNPDCGFEIKAGTEMCPRCGFVFPFATDMLAEGRLLQDRYEVQRLLHSGGMGYVYLASDSKLDRPCVVKQVKQQVKSEAHQRKLEEEALRMAQLSHPAVAMVLDHFVEDGFYFLVVEYIKGQTLSEIFEKSGSPLEESMVIDWMVQVCEVIGYLHNKGVVHRDISPDNIMLTEAGNIKMIDFGTLHDLSRIAGKKAGKEGKFGFTPKEQWEGNPVPQSDVFAIGATAYYLLTGFLQLSEAGLRGEKARPEDFDPVYPPIREKRPGIADGLEMVLGKALSPEYMNRYGEATELGVALRELSSGVEREAPKAAIAGELNLDIRQIDFGQVQPGAVLSRKFRIANPDGQLLMGSAEATQPWLKIWPPIFDSQSDVEFLASAYGSGLPSPGSRASAAIILKTGQGEDRVEVTVNDVFRGFVASSPQKGRPKWLLPVILGSIGLLLLAVGVNASGVLKPKAPAKLQASATQGSFDSLEPGLTLSDVHLRTLSNIGELPLKGTARSSAPWLLIEPADIILKPGESMELKFWVNTIGMTYEEKNNGTITIDTDGGKVAIPVNLSITKAKVIFEDDFSNSNRGWDTRALPDVERSYKQDGFGIKVKSAGSAWGSQNENLLELDDFVVEVDVKWLTAATSGSCMIGFRRSDKDNSYAYQVDTMYGMYVISKSVNGLFTTLKEWTASSAINKSTATNRLKIACQGSNLKFYINDTLVTTLTDYSLRNGRILLGVWREKNTYSDAEALFDNFKVTAASPPSASSSAAAPVTPHVVEKVTTYRSVKYTNPTYKFSIAYPAGWIPAQATLKGAVFYAKGPGKDVVYIAVRPATSFKDAANTYMTDLISASGAAFTPSIDSETTITLADGTKANVIMLSAAFGMAKAAVTGVLKDGNAIMICGASDPQSLELYKEIGSTLLVQ